MGGRFRDVLSSYPRKTTEWELSKKPDGTLEGGGKEVHVREQSAKGGLIGDVSCGANNTTTNR